MLTKILSYCSLKLNLLITEHTACPHFTKSVRGSALIRVGGFNPTLIQCGSGSVEQDPEPLIARCAAEGGFM